MKFITKSLCVATFGIMSASAGSNDETILKEDFDESSKNSDGDSAGSDAQKAAYKALPGRGANAGEVLPKVTELSSINPAFASDVAAAAFNKFPNVDRKSIVQAARTGVNNSVGFSSGNRVSAYNSLNNLLNPNGQGSRIVLLPNNRILTNVAPASGFLVNPRQPRLVTNVNPDISTTAAVASTPVVAAPVSK